MRQVPAIALLPSPGVELTRLNDGTRMIRTDGIVLRADRLRRYAGPIAYVPGRHRMEGDGMRPSSPAVNLPPEHPRRGRGRDPTAVP